MAASSSSKVTVEYHDPSGVFPLVQSQLLPRLPLRNLHWKSPTRPLRSIDSLHIDLVPSQESPEDWLKSPQPSRPQSVVNEAGKDQPTSASPAAAPEVPAVVEPARPPPKGRRHQIPGLRQTPYLKVFLLRCDDSDSYKSTQRKLVREWVRAHTPPSQISSASASTQENHDAFEWLIVHVVLPDTPAAKQPRWSSSSGEKSSSTTRWPGRGSTTLLEKIRADFNVPGKAAADRVAQVRLQKTDIPPHLLPSTAGNSTPDIEGSQELNAAWNDAITKFKTLILMSFDLRVGQYEEDIREKDLQRTLPGWNFCTFFVLKEGLARGFESVGLVEDALVGYDELSVGLDAIIREEATNGSGSNAFLEFTEDLKQQLIRAKEQGPASEGKSNATKRLSEQQFGDKPISSGRKNYRELILSNNISVFDFRCYIFSRQMALLLRLGNAQVSKSEFLNSRPKTAEHAKKSTDDLFIGLRGSGDEDGEDLTSLADLCQRTMEFITSITRIMRADLVKGTADSPDAFSASLIDNFVSSWSFAVAQQILKDTVASSLPVSMFEKSAEGLNPSKLLSGGRKHDKNVAQDQKPSALPRRTTSLLDRRASVAGTPYGQTGHVVYEHGRYSSAGQLGRKDSEPSSNGKTGLLELAAHRAELYLVQRRILERLGKVNDWAVGWAAVVSQGADHGNLTEISLDEPSSPKPEGEEDSKKPDVTPESHATIGVFNATLRLALSTFEDFRELYGQLSDLAVKHYFASNRSKSAEGVLGDLAAVKFETGDYAAAAMYFSRMAPLYAQDKWNLVEITMLKMHAQCLQKLHRKDEYIRILLDLLAKSAANRKAFANTRKRLSMFAAKGDRPWLNDDNLDSTGYLKELVAFSDELPYEVNVPMARYFGDLTVVPNISHYDDEKKDGFRVQLRIRHLLEDELLIDKAKVRLTSISTGESKEITLESSEPFDLKQGLKTIWLDCNVVTFGQYIVEKVTLQSRKVFFIHEPTKKEETLASLGITVPSNTHPSRIPRKSRILVYPRAEAFEAKLSTTRSIQIDKTKSLDLECKSFGNDIVKAEIRLKAASAGLRLHTGDAMVIEGDTSISNKPSPGVLSLAQMAPNTTTTIRIPYELEVTLQDLNIKLEVTYTTAEGEFEFRANCFINIELPLDVNVHDVFQEKSLYSRFNISTSNHIPLDLIDIKLEDSAAFTVAPLPHRDQFYPVLPQEPTAFSYQIFKKEGADLSNVPDSNLALILDYRCLNDQVFEKVERTFSEALRESSFAKFIRLLVPVLRRRLDERITPKEWKRISIREELRLGSYDEVGWQDTVDSLPEHVQPALRDWLQVWHEQTPTIPLLPPPTRSTALAAPTARRITITVGVPRMQIVHTANLSISPQQPYPKYTPPIASLGEPLPAVLRLRHTRAWDHPSALCAAAGLKDKDAEMEFVFEIEAEAETWLVGGRRRSRFSAREGEECVFPVLLVPLKDGVWGLPGVRVAPVVGAGAGAGAGAGGQGGAAGSGKEVTWEVDVQSRWAKVVVVPNWRSVTVGLEGFGEDGGGSVLLETEGREERVVL